MNNDEETLDQILVAFQERRRHQDDRFNRSLAEVSEMFDAAILDVEVAAWYVVTPEVPKQEVCKNCGIAGPEKLCPGCGNLLCWNCRDEDEVCSTCAAAELKDRVTKKVSWKSGKDDEDGFILDPLWMMEG